MNQLWPNKNKYISDFQYKTALCPNTCISPSTYKNAISLKQSDFQLVSRLKKESYKGSLSTFFFSSQMFYFLYFMSEPMLDELITVRFRDPMLFQAKIFKGSYLGQNNIGSQQDHANLTIIDQYNIDLKKRFRHEAQRHEEKSIFFVCTIAFLHF